MIKQWREDLKLHGFGRIKRQTYGRVVGDGILQLISCDPYWYLDQRSPAMTTLKRRDRLIQYGMWSLYEKIPEESFYEFWRAIDTSSMWRCCDIRGERFYEVPFMGFAADLETLRNQGFAYFDSINSHEKLLQEYRRLQMIEFKSISEEDSKLAMLYLMNGARERAMGTLACCFMDIMWFARTRERFYVGRDKASVLQEKYMDALKWNEGTWNLWKALNNEDDEAVRKQLMSNYTRNMELVKKYRIPIVPSYSPMNLSELTWREEV